MPAAAACGPDAAAFAGELDAVLLLVVNAAQCKAVLFGENGLAAKLRPGTGVMVSATISAADAKSIAAGLEPFGLLVLDAPVSGGAVKAAAGQMTVMASGAPAAFDRLSPVLDAVAGKVYRIGEEIGLGATVKIVHQLLAGVHIAAGAEAMALAARAGIPLDTMYEVVTNAAGNSWMFENRMKHVVDGDYTPHSAVDIFVKDLRLVAETALSLGFPLPLASTAYTMFANASNAGFGREGRCRGHQDLRGHRASGREEVSASLGPNSLRLGVIADDFTGATDIAGFLVANGLRTVQLNGVPPADLAIDVDAVVISLKTRSCAVDEAVSQSLAALDWLRARDCPQFFFKYCSTFDSTPQGNIGPVTDALLAALDEDFTVICPVLPVNGRTIYNGYLFVNGVPLDESGMRHHPGHADDRRQSDAPDGRPVPGAGPAMFPARSWTRAPMPCARRSRR